MTALRTNFAPLRLRNFRWYLASTICVTLSNEVQGAVLSWQVFQITHSYSASGLIGLAEALPAIAVSLYAGHLTDRVDRRRLGLMASVVLLLCGGLLLTASCLVHQRHRLLVALYTITALSGLGRSFFGPARSALGADVPRDLYAQAVSLRSASWQLGVIVGPGLGGLMIGCVHGRVWLAYLVDLTLMGLGILSLAAIRHRSPPAPDRREPLLTSLRTGISFVLHERTLLAAMCLDLFAVLFGGAVAMLPAFATQILLVGPVGFGWLRSGQSIGAVVMWGVLGLMPPLPRAGAIMLWAVAGFGACWMAIAVSTSVSLTMALLMIAGALDYVSVVVRSTLVQSRTPSHMLGRVSAVNAIFIGSSNDIGGFESGIAARMMGLQRSVALGGAITLSVVAITAACSRQLRRLGRLDQLDVALPAAGGTAGPGIPGTPGDGAPAA